MNRDRLTYAVSPWLAVALFVATLLLYGAADEVSGPGRWLFRLAALVAWIEFLRSVILRPTLVADEQGIEVATGWSRKRFPWSSVVSVGVLGAAAPPESRRLRRRANALEIDLGERLVVIPGYRLGKPAAQVAAGITMSGRTTSPV